MHHKTKDVLSFLLMMSFELLLRSCEIITVNYFCVRRKNRREHNQHFKGTLMQIRKSPHIFEFIRK